MFQIRRVYDDVLPVNQSALREVHKIFVDQFPGAPIEDVEQLGERLRNPFEKRFRTILTIAMDSRRRVTGFAIVLHDPEIGFCYLDYLAAGKRLTGRGVGAALYEHIRSEAVALGAVGLFFECLPDEPALCADAKIRRQNAARLRFYEQYGARPIEGTAYETPPPGSDPDNMPYLVWDPLDRESSLRVGVTRQVVQAILERKYKELCPPEYVRQVLDSFHDDPVRIRAQKYPATDHPVATAPPTERVVLTVNDKHDIHHIRERGYVESPVRIRVILEQLEKSDLFETVAVAEHPMSTILEVHDRDFVDYLHNACESVPAGKSLYPYVFPIRNALRPPKELAVRAGYYCIDTFTPLNRNAFPAAKRAVDCVLTAADAILEGRRLAYALVRPPGHHAERRSFGGFCYFGNAAIAAQYFSKHSRVAILDVDYHHGNSQQDIFYERSDVLTVSIHGDPDFAYPYFTGFADEAGSGEGLGFNVNYPLPEEVDGERYRETLAEALDRIRRHDPSFLVIALGLDPAKGDPTGTWLLSAKDFHRNGEMIGDLRLPTLVVQEGGYRTRTLGVNARSFFQGLVTGAHRP
ncbi:MAG: histone deacetylase family protein [Planctomycetes bacterium]|nr:histone deacetylase family protein [Planctomycetota bacterium]